MSLAYVVAISVLAYPEPLLLRARLSNPPQADGVRGRGTASTNNPQRVELPLLDVIIGNPPFLSDKRMISVLGEDLAARLRTVYRGRVPGGADLVVYWIEKAWH